MPDEKCQDSTACPYLREILVIEGDIRAMKNEFRDLKHDIHGNGQPGLITKIDQRFDRLDDKIGRLQVLLVALGLGAAGGSGATWIIKALFGG